MTDEWPNVYASASSVPHNDNEGLRGGVELWKARPELRAIYENSRRTMIAPWSALGLALVRSLVSIPYWVQYQSFLGTAPLNIGIVFIGDSGGGKSRLPGMLDASLPFVGLHVPNFTQVEVGSGEAIADVYAHVAEKDEPQSGIRRGDLVWHNQSHSRLFSFDEVGRLFKMGSRDSGSTIFEYVKQGLTGGPLGRRLAKGQGTMLDPGQYRFGFVTNAQPARSGVLLNEDEIEGGLPGRLLWFETRDPRAVTEEDRSPVMPHAIKDIDWRGIRIVEGLPQMDEAHRQERAEYHTDQRDPLDGHRSLAQVKVAIGLMRLNGRVFLNDEDWDLAHIVMDESTRVRSWVQQTLAVRSREAERQRGESAARQQTVTQEAIETLRLKRICDRLRAYQKEGRPQNKWRGSLNSTDRPYYDDAMRAIESGEM